MTLETFINVASRLKSAMQSGPYFRSPLLTRSSKGFWSHQLPLRSVDENIGTTGFWDRFKTEFDEHDPLRSSSLNRYVAAMNMKVDP